MKKSLLILSMLALTATAARAYDTLEAGTDGAPNYYLIKANSGEYLTYSATAKEISSGGPSTNLYRIASPTEASVWAVTVGTEDNTFHIKNYTADQYLMQFFKADGTASNDHTEDESQHLILPQNGGNYANTSSSPVNVYAGSFGRNVYSLKVASGDYGWLESVLQDNLLIAPTGTEFCGNWWNSSLAETHFSVYKLEITEGADVQSIINARLSAIPVDDARDIAKAKLDGYIASAPSVVSILEPAVESIKSATTIDEINSAVDEVVVAANTALKTNLNNVVYAVKNVRRESKNVPSYLSLNTTANEYTPVNEMSAPVTWFKFINYPDTDGGYYLQSMSDNTYIDGTGEKSNNNSPSSSACCVIYPILCTSADGFSGLSFRYANGTQGFNMNTNTNGTEKLTTWNYTDGGSIWAITNVWDTYAQPSVDELNTYIETYGATVPPAGEVFNKAVESINAIGYTNDLVTKPAEIKTTAITDALKTTLDGKVYSLKSLRREHATNAAQNTPYFALNSSSGKFSSVANDNEPTAWYLFTSTDNGGYTVRNYYNGEYVYTGSNGSYGVAASSATESTIVYPTLITNGSYSGIAFPYVAGGMGYNVDTSSPTNLTSWATTGNDKDGSIWAIALCDDSKIEAYYSNTVPSLVASLGSYAENVKPVAAIFTKAKEDMQAIVNQENHTIGTPAQIEKSLNDAIADANNFLKAGLGNKIVSVRSLRNGYIVAGENGYTISSTENDLANYDFIAAEDGGYTLYNQGVKKYVGPVEDVVENGYTSHVVKLSDAAADALTVFPVINHNGAYYGVSFPLTDGGTNGFNTNANGLFTYGINDGGSIFAIDVTGETTEIAEVEATAPAADMIYDLSGRRLSAPVKGINIINGKKVLVK